MFKNYRYNTFTCHLSYYKIPGHYKLDSLEVKEITLLIFPGEKLLFSHSVMSDSWWPHGLQHVRLPCLSLSPRVCSNSCPLGQWCCPTISSSAASSSCPQSFSASASFPVSRLFSSGGQSTEASALVLPMNIQNWFPLELTGLISLQSKGLSRVFSTTTVWKHQFFGAQPSLWPNCHIHTGLLDATKLWSMEGVRCLQLITRILGLLKMSSRTQQFWLELFAWNEGMCTQGIRRPFKGC